MVFHGEVLRRDRVCFVARFYVDQLECLAEGLAQLQEELRSQGNCIRLNLLQAALRLELVLADVELTDIQLAIALDLPKLSEYLLVHYLQDLHVLVC